MSPRRARAVQGHLESDPAGALRRHLVNVTRRLLAAHGLGGLTTREIARAADVSDGVLYNHFADKDELILEALRLELANLGDQFRKAMPAPGTATVEANLVAIAMACTAFQAGALPLAGALLGRAELLARFLELIHAGDSGPQHIITAIAGYLDAEMRAGRAADDADSTTVAIMLFGACQAQLLGAHFGQMTDTAAEPDSRPTVAVLMRSLQPR
jgi:AcrR family transcriptional regulator